MGIPDDDGNAFRVAEQSLFHDRDDGFIETEKSILIH